MATQGIVSILGVDGRNVLFKVIAGSNGGNASKLVEWAKSQTGALTMESIYEAARKVDFGTQEDLVVQDSAGSLCYAGDGGPQELGELYRDCAKFRNPRFNPRWKQGIADHVEVVVLSADGVRAVQTLYLGGEAVNPDLVAYLNQHRELAAKHFGLTPQMTTDGLVIAYIDVAGDGVDAMPDCVFEEFTLAGYERLSQHRESTASHASAPAMAERMNMDNLQLWTVSGRVSGDDDDTVHHIWALNQGDAEAKFDAQLRDENDLPTEDNDEDQIYIISSTPVGTMINGVFVLEPDLQVSYAYVSEVDDTTPLIKVTLELENGDVGIETVEFHASSVLKHHGINGVWGNLGADWNERSLAEDYALWSAKRQYGDQREYRVEVIDNGLALEIGSAPVMA